METADACDCENQHPSDGNSNKESFSCRGNAKTWVAKTVEGPLCSSQQSNRNSMNKLKNASMEIHLLYHKQDSNHSHITVYNITIIKKSKVVGSSKLWWKPNQVTGQTNTALELPGCKQVTLA